MTTAQASMPSNRINVLQPGISVKLGVDTPIDIFATGICAAEVDVLTTRIGTANGATSVSLYGQNQRANYHCAYKTEFAKHCPIFHLSWN